MTWIDPAEMAAWDGRRRRATNQYQVGQAQGQFNRSLGKQNQGIETRNLTQQYGQMRENLPGSYARRGMLNSGIYGRGLQQYGTQRTTAFGDLASKYQQQFGQLDLTDQANTVNYNDQLGDINDQERVRRAQLASALRGI